MPEKRPYHLLDKRLWGLAFARRSDECTPLYICPYKGPRLLRTSSAHVFWELIAVLKGRGELLGLGEAVPMEPGMVLLVPQGMPHREHADRDIDTIWIGCRGSRFRGVPRHLVAARDPRLVAECERLWLLSQQTAEKVGPALDLGVTALLSDLLRAGEAAKGEAPRGDVIDGIIRHLSEHLAEPMRLADLARRAGCSKGYFSYLFRQRTGQSALAFLTGLRVRQAAHLLDLTGLTVSEIAARVGFASLFYFSRVFRHRFGLSPRAYRLRPQHDPAAADM